MVMACRDMDACEEAKNRIINDSFNKSVECKRLDLASLKSIREFASDYLSSKFCCVSCALVIPIPYFVFLRPQGTCACTQFLVSPSTRVNKSTGHYRPTT